MKSTTLSIITLIFFSGLNNAQNNNEWRPENRTGVSAETGLMKSWPAAGPTLLWSNLELGKGFSSPVFGSKTIYITGNKGSNGAEDILFALDMNGRVLWQTAFGRAGRDLFRKAGLPPLLKAAEYMPAADWVIFHALTVPTGK
jgi:outer membrane protein assembly factor BamB